MFGIALPYRLNGRIEHAVRQSPEMIAQSKQLRQFGGRSNEHAATIEVAKDRIRSIETEHGFQSLRFLDCLLYQALSRYPVGVMNANRGHAAQRGATPLDQMSRRRSR